MATSRKGIDIEVAFRAHFNIDPSVDVVELMDAVIDVASAIYPQDQFKKRRQTLINDLDEIMAMRVVENAKRSDDHLPANKSDHGPCTKKADKSCHEKEKKIVAASEEKAALDLKFENSTRRFQQGLDEIRKGKRKIQVLDMKDVPKLPPRKVLCNKSRVRVRAVR